MCLDEGEAAQAVELHAQLEELLEDVLRALVAPDHAVPVEQRHVACARVFLYVKETSYIDKLLLLSSISYQPR